MTTIYVTKWCLTNGIVKVIDATQSTTVHGGYSYADGKYTRFVYFGDYYLNEQRAMLQASSMRDRKLNSLKKQVAKLESLDFGGSK
jgi:hypothetical protein